MEAGVLQQQLAAFGLDRGSRLRVVSSARHSAQLQVGTYPVVGTAPWWRHWLRWWCCFGRTGMTSIDR